MNREILRIAFPNIVSNITVPLMGIVSTAIAGHIGSDSALMIGELAIGASIFNFIYWNCSFVRMGTSGLTAQAFGRGDFSETTRMLIRALSVALLLGIFVILFRVPVAEGAVRLMNGNDIAMEYVEARLWAVPACVLLFGFHGWFTGMQNAIIPMVTAIFVNLLHILASYYLSFNCDMGILGIAYASVIAQWVGVVLAVFLLIVRYGKVLVIRGLEGVYAWAPLREFFGVNSDIIVRSFCNVCVYSFFTASSARMGDKNLLAVNTLLLELFTLFSYMTDGFAYAAEALTGRFVGAKDQKSLIRCIAFCIRWSLLIALLFVAIYVLGWRSILSLFMSEGDSGRVVLELAGHYIGWIIAVPLACALPFLFDGIMVGATLTHVMRNSMIAATVGFFAIYFSLYPLMENNALWFAFVLFIVMRGGFQYLFTHGLKDIYKKALSGKVG
ncbi:MAG: MATE family efflux transporter [Rikenellaceae bacterium]